MTPNGAVLFTLLVVTATLVARDATSLGVVLAAVAMLALSSGRRAPKALLWSLAIVAPLAMFMALVWIGIVGRSPAEIAARAEGSRIAAAHHVLLVCLRLFIIAFAIQAVLLRFAHWTPLAFVRALTAPPVAKKLIVLSLSLIETTLHAVDRARTALIAGGIITRGRSWRNIANGWLLVQTVWLTVITTVIGRLRDKWPVEGTMLRLDAALAQTNDARFVTADLLWLALASASFAAAIGLR